MKKELCTKFACIYATNDGCSIQGWTSEEGELNGKKEFCVIYAVMCKNVKCDSCSRSCKKEES